MSTVSIQNESLPSFEPIEHAPQKRKRATIQDSDSQPIIKKTRAKSGISDTPSVIITKSAVWIGAILKEENDIISAAFSVYYGSNDVRNCTEKVILQLGQNLDYVYTMGAIRALELCEDDTSLLYIHTGSKLLEQVTDLNIKDESEIHDRVLEKIAMRKGSTSILYRTNSSAEQHEYQVAHDMAKDTFLEDDMMVDENETLVDSLTIKESKIEVVVTTTETITTTTYEENEQEEIEQEKVVVTIEEEVASSSSVNVERNKAAPSWTYALGLDNLLNILKAPFSRKNKQQ